MAETTTTMESIMEAISSTASSLIVTVSGAEDPSGQGMGTGDHSGHGDGPMSENMAEKVSKV